MTARVLIVEDEQPTRMALAYQLTYAGYDVAEAASGEEALTLLEQGSFDCVLTDIVMGKIDGLAVLHAARCQPYQPCVILLTGYGSLETSVAALRDGAVDYLLKPCTHDQLMASVREAVKRHTIEQQIRTSADQLLAALRTTTHEMTSALSSALPQKEKTPACIEVGALMICMSHREVWFNGHLLSLTPIEYTLIRFLAETPGQVRRYTDIVYQTHGLETDQADAQQLLRTHIRNVRRKIRSDCLVTHRGIGMMLTYTGESHV